MSDTSGGPRGGNSPNGNPMEQAQRAARPVLPSRFYREVRAERDGERFVLKLDGRAARTPGRNVLGVSDEALADALVAEWDAQTETIDPATMPATRLVNSALDRVAGAMDEVRADIVKYAGSDLICYREDVDEGLAAHQEREWGPIVAWAASELGAPLALAGGVIAIDQPPEAADAVAGALHDLDALALAGVHATTTLTGSAFLALAGLKGRLDADGAWRLAHLDEDWQMAKWGRDEEALERREARRAELNAAFLAFGSGKA